LKEEKGVADAHGRRKKGLIVDVLLGLVNEEFMNWNCIKMKRMEAIQGVVANLRRGNASIGLQMSGRKRRMAYRDISKRRL
jgi:hypothetical protein